MARTSGGRRKVLVFDGKEAMAGFMAGEWSEIADGSIRRRGCFTAALSGGRTPVDFYRKIASLKEALPWDKTHIFLADERLVPFTHHESNYGMVADVLLSKVGLPDENRHPVPTGESPPEMSAQKYEDGLRKFFGLGEKEFPEFDLIVLGIGEDGHVASLFPGSPALDERVRLAVAVIPGGAGSVRVTLTLPVINNARNVIFLVSGKNKAEISRRVVEERDVALPASLIIPEKGNLLFVLDREAAACLSTV